MGWRKNFKERMSVSSAGARFSSSGNCKAIADPRESHCRVLGSRTRPRQAEEGIRGEEAKTVIVHYSF